MPLPSALASAVLAETVLGRTALGDRFDRVVGQAPGHRSWLASVAAFHDLGSLVGFPSDTTYAAMVNALRGNGPARVRAVLEHWLGRDALYLLRAITAGWEGVVYPEDSRARLPATFEDALLGLDDLLRTEFPHAVRPPLMRGYLAQRLLSGLVALAVQLHDGGGFGNEVRWGNLRTIAWARVEQLGIDPAFVRWPDTPPTGLPTNPGVTIFEDGVLTDVGLQAVHYGLDLVRAKRVDNIVFACFTRTSVLHVYDQLLPIFGPLVIRGLPWDVEPEGGWFTDGTNRYPLAPVCITTQEQVFNSIRLERHAYLRGAALARSLLIIHDLYTTDNRQRSLAQALVHHQMLVGGHVSVTSPVLNWHSRREILLERLGPTPQHDEELDEIQEATTRRDQERAEAVPYPCVTHGEREGRVRTIPGPSARTDFVPVEFMPDGSPEAIARCAIQHWGRGARVLVVRNTWRDTFATAQAIERLEATAILRVNGLPVLYHTRYTAEDRHAINDAVVATMGIHPSSGPCIIVATCHVENGLRLDADVILTDFCPIDALLRRAGRMHSQPGVPRPVGYDVPRLYVVEPPTSNFLGEVTRSGAPRRLEHGLGSIYRNMFVLRGTSEILHEDLRIDRGLPREDVEWCLHAYSIQRHLTAMAQPDHQAHAVWLLNHAEPHNVSANSLRWPAVGCFGEENCDVPQDRPWREPPAVYIQGRPEMRVWFPGVPSPLGTPMRAVVVERHGDFVEGQSVDPDPFGVGYRFGGGLRHEYDNYGYRYVADADEE